MVRRLCPALCALALLPACGGGAPAPPQPAASAQGVAEAVAPPAFSRGRALAAMDVLVLVSGATQCTLDHRICIYREAGGRQRMRMDGEMHVGGWRVEPDGRLCSNWITLPAHGAACSEVLRNGAFYTLVLAGGDPVHTTIAPGNRLRG